jgi:hypothetical protein
VATVLRSSLTELVLTTLRTSGLVIGDGEVPDANWIGQPGLPESEYEAFAVVSELTADHSEGPIGASQGDWRMPYMLEYFGISRSQVSWLADTLRGVLLGLRFTTLAMGTSSYKVQLVRPDAIGAPQQITVTYPPFWHQQDNVTVWIGKQVGEAMLIDPIDGVTEVMVGDLA